GGRITRRVAAGGAGWLGVGAGLTGLLGAACGAGAPAGSAGGATAGGGPAAGIRPGTTVTFFHGGQQAEADARSEQIKAFNAAFPQIKAEALYTPQDAGGKLDALIGAGTPPDMLYIGNGADVTTRAARGSLQDLNPLVRRDRFDTADFFESAVALYQLCGKQYAYPSDFPNQALYYNAELFEQAGVKPPPDSWGDDSWTFDRFLDSARRVTRETNAGTQWGYLTAHSAFRNWWVWVAANGGEMLDKDSKTCLLNEPPAVEALQFMQDLVFKHRVMPDPAGYTEAGTNLNGFFNARGVMSTLPPWLGQVRRDMRQRWDVAPHPKGNGSRGRKACAGGGTGLALASPGAGGKNVNEAWELLKFVSLKPQVETFTRINGIVPPLKSVANSPVFADPAQPPKGIKVFTDGAQYLRSDPSVVRWNDINRAVTEELGPLWSNAANARTVADNIKRKVDGILAEIQSSGEMACK
ncbi:MAG TPA: extracellular solute-binding protein, partial [Chloroflexota bacterium]|nr:extracellular solute-binding protein [Chloroflexota bacterium]